MKRKDFEIILRLVADVLYAFGFFLLVPFGLALFRGEQSLAWVFGAEAASMILGCGLARRFLSSQSGQQRHAAIALALMWTFLGLLSFVPFLVQGLTFADALFESFSAWTDTGLTMVPDPAELPLSLGTFRILIQWISGLGIVILMLFLYGPSSRSAYSLFRAEGRTEGFSTSIWHMGRTILLIYVGYTLVGFLALWALGLAPYEALMHAITSLSTGGFSTNSVGVGLYGAMPTIVALVLMLCGGISFGSHYELLRGNWRGFLRNPEIRILLAITVGGSGLLMLEHWLIEGRFGDRILSSVFYTVGALSTCGAGTVVPLSKTPDVVVFTVMLFMISGAAYGSTTGALKLWRLLIVAKIIGREIKRPFYPEQTVLPILVGGVRIHGKTVIEVSAYVLLYVTIAIGGSLLFMLSGHSVLDSLFTVFSAQGNVGLNAMPDGLYYGMHPLLKVQLVLHMLIGRMEILPLLYLVRGIRE